MMKIPSLKIPSLIEIFLFLAAASLATLTWYATLEPYWAFQSGHANEETYYSQGIGLWLNYTEHVGDLTFDPGNSLWVPTQPTGVHTFSQQCVVDRSYCSKPLGELHRQYCGVLDVYCGAGVMILQILMSIVSGLALLVLLWTILLLVTKHRTIVDKHLMNVCIFNGVALLLVAGCWYFLIFRQVMNTTFYKDQYNRCQDSTENRTCWGVGLCMYLAIIGSVLYPMMSLLIATHVTNKFRLYQRDLRKLHEEITVVTLPVESPVSLRQESINADVCQQSQLSEKPVASLVTSNATTNRQGTQIDLAAQHSLPSLKRIDISSRLTQLESSSESPKSLEEDEKL